MAVIHKPDNKPLDPKGVLGVPAWMVPSFRTVKAAESGNQFNIVIKAHGGVGDVICSEPAIRFALDRFKGSKISLLTPYPELFRHLTFHEVWTNRHEDPPCQIPVENYLMFQTIDVTNELSNEFICHALMGGVDFASLNMWRLILPNHYKRIQLYPTPEEYAKADAVSQPRDVVLHPGKTWPSRTFPKKWWDAIIQGLVAGGARPILIGGVVDKGRASTVEVDTTGCLDLRHSQSLMETVALLHRSKVLLTNDSSPLHMASTGDTWIGFLSTVKHPDLLTHWRVPFKDGPDKYAMEYGWRMKDFSRGGLYQELDICPNNPKTVHVDNVEITALLKWLPDPLELVSWALSKL